MDLIPVCLQVASVKDPDITKDYSEIMIQWNVFHPKNVCLVLFQKYECLGTSLERLHQKRRTSYPQRWKQSRANISICIPPPKKNPITLYNIANMIILHLACLNDDSKIYTLLGNKCLGWSLSSDRASLRMEPLFGWSLSLDGASLRMEPLFG